MLDIWCVGLSLEAGASWAPVIWEAGMVLVVMSVVEQRLDAVRAVLAGARIVEVAARVGVSRQSVHAWVGRYLAGGVGGLADRSHRPVSCPHQVPAWFEARIVEMRREHPRWGARRMRLELLRQQPPSGDGPSAGDGQGVVVLPSVSTINRVLHRHGLVRARPRKKPRSAYQRFQRPGPMQLWGIDIVGGIRLVDASTGQIREAKIVTGIDDHSRYVVMAAVVERATGRAVCVALAQALARYGIPEEVITDNGKQFTARFARGGEVLFDRICRHNGITHHLTMPGSPNQNGKVERFHGTFRPDMLAEAGPFESLLQAQAAVDGWVCEYNTNRPHQGLDPQVPVTPADRFHPATGPDRDVLGLWLPPALAAAEPDTDGSETALKKNHDEHAGASSQALQDGQILAVELDRVIPVSGNLAIGGRQIWFGTPLAGRRVQLWIGVDFIHASLDGTRIKTLRSRFSTTDLTRLLAQGAHHAGPAPLTATAPGQDGVIEVERSIARTGATNLGGQVINIGEHLAGRRVGLRIQANLIQAFDLDSRELLHTRVNPIPATKLAKLRNTRPAGPPLRPSQEPVTVQRRASATGTILIAGQPIHLGRDHAGQPITIHVSETTLAIDLDQETRLIPRTNTKPVRSIKGQRPLNAAHVS